MPKRPLMTLVDLLDEWRQWSKAADRSDDGWESDFPKWGSLIDAAQETMLSDDSTPDDIAALAECFSLAQEAEELLEFAAHRVDECWPVLQRLANSQHAGCRWQVYAAVGAKGNAAEGLLRAGLADADGYARRRAALSLAGLRPADAEALAERILGSPDPYLRQAGIEMVKAAPSVTFRRRVLGNLLADASANVRDAAARALAEI